MAIKFCRSMMLLLILCLPQTLMADVGSVLFVYGGAYRDTLDGERVNLVQGDTLEEGDVVTTSINGRVQLRLADGGLIALKPNTEFQIEAFSYAPESDETATSPRVEPKSFFALLKGGFRSITGAVGKENKSQYRVKTPVATIGIRGTDYSAQLCAGDCGNNPDGLSVAVLQGGVILKNDAGSVEIDAGETAFVKDALTPPVQTGVNSTAGGSSSQPQSSDNQQESQDQETEVTVATTTDEGADLTGGGASISGSVAVASNQSASIAGFADAATGEDSQLFIDSAGNVTGFAANQGVDGRVAIGSARNINLGADPTTGLRWGRWSGGSADVVLSDGTQQAIDLNNSSLHWITGDLDTQQGPVLPSTGVVDFSLVGNTNPTDNRGNVGVLGSASLTADFTNQSVDADVSLTIANENWDASAQDVSLNGDAADFAGDFDTVTIQDASGVRDGNGSLSGFFTGDDSGTLDGAGLGYTLSDDAGVDVAGTAAFQTEPTGNP